MAGKPCIWCGADLDKADLDELDSYNVPSVGLTITCKCELQYSLVLVETTPWDTWLDIFRQKGYRVEREGNEVTIHDLKQCPC